MTKIYTTIEDDQIIYPIFAIFAYLKSPIVATNLISTICNSEEYYNHPTVSFLRTYDIKTDKLLFNILKLKVPNIVSEQTLTTWKSYLVCKGYGEGKNIAKTTIRRNIFIEAVNQIITAQHTKNPFSVHPRSTTDLEKTAMQLLDTINVGKLPVQASAIVNTNAPATRPTTNTIINKQDSARIAVIETLKKVDPSWDGGELRILFDSILKGLKL